MSYLLSSFDKRKNRIRGRIKSNNKASRPRITVFRSNKNIYAQLVALNGDILVSCSSLSVDKKQLKDSKGVDIAKLVGDKFAKLCVKNNLSEVVFDKGAYLYNGRVKALAEACREAGLKF